MQKHAHQNETNLFFFQHSDCFSQACFKTVILQGSRSSQRSLACSRRLIVLFQFSQTKKSPMKTAIILLIATRKGGDLGRHFVSFIEGLKKKRSPFRQCVVRTFPAFTCKKKKRKKWRRNIQENGGKVLLAHFSPRKSQRVTTFYRPHKFLRTQRA